MKWKTADAKANFSELISRARQEPQLIYNRDRMVAVVINGEEFRELERLKQSAGKRNLASAFSEFSSICAEESYTFDIPPRSNRKVDLP